MHTFISDLVKRYDSGFELSVACLEFEAGQRVGLVGNNGAGKTTLLLLLLGLLKPQKGDVRLDGDSVRSFSLTWRSKTASYMDETALIPYLNPGEYWEFVADAYGLSREERVDRLTRFEGFVDLAADREKKYIRDYSQGNRKKIGLVAAMMVRPRLLVLDEPFTSLDPRSRFALENYLTSLNAEYGTTIVASSHDLDHVVTVSSRIVMLESGRVAFDGPSSGETLRFVREHLTGSGLRRAALS